VSQAISESTIAILGPGLLGGSLALALHERHPEVTVHLWGRREESLAAARQANAAQLYTTDVNEVVRGASLVILATPVETMPALMAQMIPHLAEHALVTDVGSAKQKVVHSMAELAAQSPFYFIGSHPMAGSEQTGFAAAKASLFEGATCIVTPIETTKPHDLHRLQAFWTAIGCRLQMMSPAVHDRTVARISHLPHAVSTTVVRAAMTPDPGVAQSTGNGFRDATRIAAGDPGLWAGILLENRAEVLAGLQDVQAELRELVAILESMDEVALRRYLSQAQALRRQVPPAS